MNDIQITQMTDQMWMNLDQHFDEFVEGLRIVKSGVKMSVNKYQEDGEQVDLKIAFRMTLVQQACALMMSELVKRKKEREEMDL